MLLMYVQTDTPRLQYIVNFFSQELFDRPIVITTDKQEYCVYEGAKINYSPAPVASHELLVPPVSLLFEKGIRQQEIDCFTAGEHMAFFRTDGDLSFDIFAASFYLLSRYEEYLPHQTDVFGRFAHTFSLAHRKGFLDQPLVNNWITELRAALERKFPGLVFKGKAFANVVTYDIDIAYSYLCKGWRRTLGGTARSLLKGQWKMIAERWMVLMRLRKDPFDCYERLDALHLYCRLMPYYFFLVADKSSLYDKNVSTRARSFRGLIEYYAATYHIGIHPSWQSGDQHELLKEELEWLEVVGSRPVKTSRFHYLRFNLPGSYRRLLAAGVNKDFSMGYGTVNGFRASCSSSFNWYDLEEERETTLVLYPFCFMDANSFYEARHSPREAYEELMRLYIAVKKVRGMMISIWHNHLLGTDAATTGWNQMFELFMRETVYWDAYYDGALSSKTSVPG